MNNNKTIVDYHVEFTIMSADELTNCVRERIEDGWEPLGGVSCAMDGNGRTIWTQALVKYDIVSDNYQPK